MPVSTECVAALLSFRYPSLAIFREWISNDQRATTTPLSAGIESCSLKYFSETKFVYRKIVELLVFACTNIVTHY